MKEFFTKQSKLDNVIVGNCNKRSKILMDHSNFINHRLLAVTVEVGEFVKEKDHNLKKAEYSDILHFLLSCGIALNISECVSKHDIDTLYAQSTENMYEAAVLNFSVKFSDFCNNVRSWKYWSTDRKPRNIEKHYFKCFLALFDLAKTMSYSVSDIRDYYNIKNRENLQRQENGY